jgi:hypothetical protein
MLHWIHSLTPTIYLSYSPIVQLFIGKWLITYYNIRPVQNMIANIGTQQDEINMKNQLKMDFNFLYNLLRTSIAAMNSNDELINDFDILSLECSKRLKDIEKISICFDSLYTRTLDDETKFALFFAAPLLGRWKIFVEIGKLLEADERTDMQEFSQAAIQNPNVTDYGALYEIISEKVKQTKISKTNIKY